jgi:hypothetical protein
VAFAEGIANRLSKKGKTTPRNAIQTVKKDETPLFVLGEAIDTLPAWKTLNYSNANKLLAKSAFFPLRKMD